jgi:chromosomal replication initiation ATPase DnaA
VIPKCAHCGKPVFASVTPRSLRVIVLRVVALVADECAVTPKVIMSRERNRAAKEAGFLSYWLAREHTKVGVAQLGRVFGRHHTTVLQGLRRAERLLQSRDYYLAAQRVRSKVQRDGLAVEAEAAE